MTILHCLFSIALSASVGLGTSWVLYLWFTIKYTSMSLLFVSRHAWLSCIHNWLWNCEPIWRMFIQLQDKITQTFVCQMKFKVLDGNNFVLTPLQFSLTVAINKEPSVIFTCVRCSHRR